MANSTSSTASYRHGNRRSPRIIAALVVAALVGAFGLLADEVLEGDTLNFDLAILNWFRVPGDPTQMIGPTWLQEAVRDMTSLGSFSLLGLITIVVVVALLLQHKARTGWYLAACVVGGAILSTVLKDLFNRPRPDLPAVARVFTASFPSGHATESAVVFLTIGVLLAESTVERPLKAFYLGVAIFLTLLVGVTRIYLGVHYPTDVLAGWMLGTAWALICWAGVQFLKPAPAAPTT